MTDVHFGFKNNFSTVDPVFILHSLVQKQLQNKKKLYCCFIDYKKAYDCIERGRLWYKLINLGIDGIFLSLVRSMYSEVKLCVKHLGSLSDFFSNDIGLFQGEITSPIMFSLFLNDIELHLQENIDVGIERDQLAVYQLLFADDAALILDTRKGLQKSLDSLFEYIYFLPRLEKILSYLCYAGVLEIYMLVIGGLVLKCRQLWMCLEK